MQETHDSTERRVTAGLRGASWNSELLPPGMRSQVYPTPTGDGAQAVGCLHFCGGERTAVFIMHPRELLISHYMVPYLVGGGYAAWVQSPRSIGNDIRLEHELALYDVAGGLLKLKALGFERVVLLGNSGGAGLFAFYIQQALLSPERRLTRTPGGRPLKLNEAALPEVDGLILLAPHPGQGKLLQGAIDPSVVDETNPLSVDPQLNPFCADNGFRSGSQGGAKYAPEFVTRYRKAQHDRVARIDAVARAMLTDRNAARKRVKESASSADEMRAAYQNIFQVWRTDADLRCFDLSLDVSDRRFGSVWGANPLTSNLGSVGFARTCTPDSWLSTWSGLSSNASFEKCGSAIEQPILMIDYTGDNSVFPSDSDAIFNSLRSSHVIRHRVRGNHHGQSLRLEEPSGQDIAGAHASAWLKDRFPSAVRVLAPSHLNNGGS